MAKAASLTYSPDWYAPVYLRHLMESGDKAKVRKEYTRLRDIARKRLKRMEETVDLTETQLYKRNVNHYPKLKDIKTDNELSSRLSDLARFVANQKSTVSGMEKYISKSLVTLHDHSYNFVTRENFIAFGEFMEEYRYQKLDAIYDSAEAADLYGDIVVKRKVDPSEVQKQFEYWLENRKELAKMRNLKKEWGKPDAIKARLDKRLKKKGRSKK